MLSYLSIRQKMLLLILGITTITYFVTYVYIIDSVRDKALEEGKKTAKQVALQKANDVKDMTNLPEAERKERRKKFMESVLRLYPKYDATWMSWQLKVIDKDWKESYGRERFNSSFAGNEVKSSLGLAELDGSKGSGIYELFKNDSSVKELLSEPYEYLEYDYTKSSRDTLLGISPTIRIEFDGEFAGIVGSDMSVKAFKGIADIGYYENAYAVLLSTEGVITAHQDTSLFNQSLDTLSIFKNLSQSDRLKIKRGEEHEYITTDNDLKEEVYVYMAPVALGRTDAFWTVCTIVPVEEIMAPYDSTFTNSIIVVVISLLILTVVIFYNSYSITKPLSKSTKL